MQWSEKPKQTALTCPKTATKYDRDINENDFSFR